MKAQDLSLHLGEEDYNKENIHSFLKALDGKEVKAEKTYSLYREVLLFLKEWFSEAPFIEIQTSGSTGRAKRIQAKKIAMLSSAEQTCKAVELKEGDTALLCISPKYIGGMMMIVRAMLRKMKLVLAPIQANPLLDIKEKINFAALVPMQVQSILSDEKSKMLFKQIDKVIIGGASLNNSLINELKTYPNAIYSTYGMTETLSHIALKKLNGKEINKAYYPLESIQLRQTKEGCLSILTPYISDEWLETNDLVKLYDDGSFELLGRKDNVVNSGGIKLQIEELEDKIKTILPYPIALTSTVDEQLGEALVLLIEKNRNCENLESKKKLLLRQLKEELPRYSAPKDIIYCEVIPLTPNGKINRQACKNLAQSFYSKK